MASRNRGPRANHNQDADEERRLWGQIKADAKKIDAMVVCIATCSMIAFHAALRRLPEYQHLTNIY